MKDLYSFSKDEAEHLAFYEKAKQAYKNVFKRVGLGDTTYLTYASGGMFSKFSHEFQTITDAGEDVIYINKEDYGKGLEMNPAHAALNKEIYTDNLKKELGLKGDFEEEKAAEVGNIFTLGTRFSKALGLSYKDAEGKETPVFMGSYGIGPGRLMGTIVEIMSDDKGLVWPKSVAPFAVHLVSFGKGDDEIVKTADALYNDLMKAGVEVLYDDRDVRAGEKFAESDLLGIPTRIVVGKDAVATGEFEVMARRAGEVAKKSRGDILAQ